MAQQMEETMTSRIDPPARPAAPATPARDDLVEAARAHLAPAEAARRARLDERLDEALEETFPASDPLAVTLPGPADAGPRRKRRAT